MPLHLARGDALVVWQALDRAIEPALALQPRHEPGVGVDIGGRGLLHQRQRARLIIVVLQDMRGDVVRHFLQKRVARRRFQFAVLDRRRKQDLDVDFVVGAVDARRIVDGVGVEAPAGEREGDARGLRQAEIGALADDLHAHVRSVNADCVIGAIADARVFFVRGLEIGADAAKPE